MKSINDAWKDICKQYSFQDTVDMRIAFACGARHTIMTLCDLETSDIETEHKTMSDINDQLSGFPKHSVKEEVSL